MEGCQETSEITLTMRMGGVTMVIRVSGRIVLRCAIRQMVRCLSDRVKQIILDA